MQLGTATEADSQVGTEAPGATIIDRLGVTEHDTGICQEDLAHATERDADGGRGFQ
jgi:hypothetical protein